MGMTRFLVLAAAARFALPPPLPACRRSPFVDADQNQAGEASRRRLGVVDDGAFADDGKLATLAGTCGGPAGATGSSQDSPSDHRNCGSSSTSSSIEFDR